MIAIAYIFLVASPTQHLQSLTPVDRSTRLQEEQEVYRRALKEIQKEDWDASILAMEDFVRTYPQSELADNALYWMANIYIEKEEYGLARAELQRLLNDYPKSDRARRAKARLKSLPENKLDLIQSFPPDFTALRGGR